MKNIQVFFKNKDYKIKIIDKFYLEKVKDIEKEILQLDNTKSTPSNSILTKLFKENTDRHNENV